MTESLFGSLDALAARWSVWMFHMAWQVALLAAVVWLVTRVYRKSSAGFRHLLWLVVFAKLLLPPTLATPWSAGNFVRDFLPAPQTRPLDVRELNVPAIPRNDGQVSSSVVAMASRNMEEPGTAQYIVINPLTFLMCGWAAVALGLFLFLAVQYTRYSRRILRRLSPAPETFQHTLAARANALGMRNYPLLMVSSSVQTPAVFGFWRPIILIPKEWGETVSQDEASSVLAHELAHVKRWDMAVTWLATLVGCLYWFHPAVWFAHLQLRREREMACDDMVLRSTKREGKKYASAILHVAESFTGSVPAAAGFLGLLELSDNLLHRVRSVADGKRARRLGWRSVVAAILIAVLFVPMGMRVRSSVAQERSAIRQEIETGYAQADPDLREFLISSAESAASQNLWFAQDTFDGLTSEQRAEKVRQCVAQLEGGEYGRDLCPAIAEAAVLKDSSVVSGLIRIATYKLGAQIDNRPRWMAVAAMARLGHPPTIPTLMALVDHYNTDTAMWAQAGLVRLSGRNFGRDTLAWTKWWQSLSHPTRRGISGQRLTDEPARERASCANNLKQMGIVFKMFANEHRGRWPSISSRRGNLMVRGDEIFPEFLTDLNVLRCPGNDEHESWNQGADLIENLRYITDKSYFYLGWAVTNEADGLAVLDAYESMDESARSKDIDVAEGQGTGGSGTIRRLREGVERFLITDIHDPVASARISSQIPVMWERPGHHEPAGCNVLYMDGHVVFVRPGMFPMTEKFMQRLQEVSATKEVG